MSEIAKKQIDRILKEKTNMRISKPALEELIEVLEDVAMEVGSMSADLAATSRRKTVTLEDVKLAVKQLY